MSTRALLFVTVLLSACGSALKPIDIDGDGFSPDEGDCWDVVEGPDGSGLDGSAINPGATETWYDGVDQDCDGSWDYDQDGDGFDGAADDSGEDCLDTDPTAYPGAEDAWYDGVDSDCGREDDFDQDGDGFAGAADGSGEDCDDLDPGLNPDVEEVWYDGTDQDCDGNDTDQDGDGYAVTEDCDDTNDELFPDFSIEEIWYNGEDENCDGNDGDQDGDGYVSDDYAAAYDWEAHNAHLGTGDCWDDAVDTGDVPAELVPVNDFGALGPDEVGPDATERWYDAVDQDCDGESDFDQDEDGYDTEFYPNREGELGDDCIDGSDLDDENPGALEPFDVNPVATESWYDGTDQDCAGDDDFDQDTDGYQAAGYGEGTNNDCADDQPEINPGAREDCSTSADDNCDDDTNDVGARGCTTYYTDADSDDFGTGSGACLCVTTTTYEVTNDDDCDDTDADINPDATEGVGDEVDQDCDGGETCYLDYDNDGYAVDGDTKASLDTDCDDTREASASEPDGDCDDSLSTINPGATETTGDEVDQDCDGDEICYADGDNDGYRTTSTVSSTDEDCDDSGEASSSVTSGDCDDSNSGVSPGDTEITGDEIDQNCDDKETCYADNDNDGYRTTSTKTSSDEDCDDSGEAASSVTSGDCDDSDSGVSPGDTEITGDEIDQNCDDKEVCYVDADNDGYRLSTTVTSADENCDDSGEATSGEPDDDCADSDEDTFPGASETCEDDVVNDCDGDEVDALLECAWDAAPAVTTATARRSGGAASDGAGTRVAFGGDVDGDGDDELLIASTGAATSAGRIYVVAGSPSGDGVLTSSTYYSYLYTGAATGDQLGTGLAAGLDTDDDGYDDVLVGAPYNNAGGGDAGAAYLIDGPLPASGTMSSTIYTAALTGVAGGDFAGSAVLGAGDVDGDGYDDALIGAEKGDSGGANGGDAYLILGPLASGGLDSTAASTWGGSYSGEDAGTVLAAGDVNGDGKPDLFIGAPNARVGTSANTRGRSYVVFGPATTEGELSDVADVDLQGAADSDTSGTALACGDVDGDGADDLLVGAPGVDSGASGGGAAYLVLGGSSLPSSALTLSSADVVLTGVAASDAAGTTVAAADLTGDGLAEILVGAPGADGSGTDRGRVYLFFGEEVASGSLSGANVIYSGEANSDALGSSLAAGGDADKDGYLDLLFGAPSADPTSGSNAGMVYFFPGTGY